MRLFFFILLQVFFLTTSHFVAVNTKTIKAFSFILLLFGALYGSHVGRIHEMMTLVLGKDLH